MSTSLQKNRINRLLPGSLREFDNLFDHFFRADDMPVWRAAASVWEADDQFHVQVDAPGVEKESIELTFDKGVLQIGMERKAPEVERTTWYNERGFGKIVRSLSLPDTVDPESITAELVDGVLHITIAKLPTAQPKKIDVKVS